VSLICSSEYFLVSGVRSWLQDGQQRERQRVFLPDKEDCLEYLREQRWPDKVIFPHCGSADTIKKGTTRKDAQRYRCHNCDSIFNDLTETVFSEHKLSLPEMFHIIRGMEEDKTAQITQELDRTYKTVLDFVHEVQDVLDDDPEFDLTGVYEADEVYVVAGKKGVKQESPRSRGLKKRDEEGSKQTNRQS
jgi:transposase-like protein